MLQSLNWYRHEYAERQVSREPGDVMFLSDTQPVERQIVKLSFEFARADAELEKSTAFAQDLATGRFTGHVATFSNSLVFVSPATGLLKFDCVPEKASQSAPNKD